MQCFTGPHKIKFIFQDNNNWQRFALEHPQLMTPAILESIQKLFDCGTEAMGYHTYVCPQCGYTVKVPHSCKSRFCSSCGKVATDKWMHESLNRLLNVPYFHIVFTIPQQLRRLVKDNRILLNQLSYHAAHSIIEWAKKYADDPFVPGIISVLHTFGADLKYHPHIHLLVTAGGLSLDKSRWVPDRRKYLLPEHGLKKRWKYRITSTIRDLLKEQQLNIPLLEMYSTDSKIRKLLNDLWCKIWYVFIGKRLSDASYTIHYIGRYTKRPVISETRIYKYDGKTVTFLYKDTSTGEKTHVTLPVDEFIKRLIQHIPDKHFRQVRYYGIFAPKSQATGLNIARKLVNKPPARMVKSLPQNWRERRISQTGFDPLICPRCNIELELVDVTYGPDYNDYNLELFDARGDPCFGNVKYS